MSSGILTEAILESVGHALAVATDVEDVVCKDFPDHGHRTHLQHSKSISSCY